MNIEKGREKQKKESSREREMGREELKKDSDEF